MTTGSLDINDSIVPLTIPGVDAQLRMQVHGDQDQHVSKFLRENGIWEPYETQLLLELLAGASNFVDVGANIGYYSVIAAAVMGEAKPIFAFEPDPDNFALLRDNIALNQAGSVVAVNAALHDADTSGRLYLSDTNFGDHQVYSGGDERHSTSIELIDGGNYLQPMLDSIEVLKIDTQGAEFHVMSGLMPLLRQSPKLRAIVEYWPFGLRRAGASGTALLQLIEPLGLQISIIDHINFELAATTFEEMYRWTENVDAVPEDEGFINILLSPDQG